MKATRDVMRFDPAASRGTSGAWSDDSGRYHCDVCHASWMGGSVRRWWPVRVGLAGHWSFGTHGVEVGAEAIERRVFATVVSVGPLRVVFGAPARGGEGGR